MPKFDLYNVHDYKRDEETGQVHMIKKNPYTRLVKQGSTPVICQDGALFFENGDPCIKAPDWVVKGLKVMTEDGRKNIGFSRIPRVGENLFKDDSEQDDSPEVVGMEE